MTRPVELGGLGITNLQQLSWALNLRWLWLQKTEPDKVWNFFPVHAPKQVKAFFSVAIVSEVGNGKNTCFWSDRCLHGQRLHQLLPHLFAAIAPRARKRSVFDALDDARWISDIKGALTLEVLAEYLELWDFLSNFSLQAEVEDVHVWQFSTTGQYTNKSAYEALFIGATSFGPWKQIWKSWAPGKCKFFLWTAALNRIWTADRLARKGLSHPAACPLCDQAEETADHLLVACVFSRQVWFMVLQTYSLQTLAPLNDLSFFDWWMAASNRVDGLVKKGFDSILILGAWTIWKHRNRYVFDGITPDVSCVVSVIKEDLRQWSFAGARGVSHVLALGNQVV